MFSKLNNYFSNLKIRDRLVFGCLFLFIVFLVSSSLSLASLSKSNSTLEQIVYTSSAKKTIPLNEIKDAVYNIDLEYTTVIMTEDKILFNEKLNQISENSKKLEQKIKRI